MRHRSTKAHYCWPLICSVSIRLPDMCILIKIAQEYLSLLTSEVTEMRRPQSFWDFAQQLFRNKPVAATCCGNHCVDVELAAIPLPSSIAQEIMAIQDLFTG